MTRLVLLVVVILPAFAYSQKKDQNLAVFGKVDKLELETKSCDFESDADVLVLSDYGKSYVDIRNGDLYTEFTQHRRIKILKEAGKNQASVKIPYVSFRNAQTVTNLTANTYNLDASGNIVVSKVEKNLVYDKKISARRSEQTFTFPDVQAGSIIEFKYTIRNGWTRYWTMQGRHPIKYSKYEIDFPSQFDMYIAPQCTLPFDLKDQSTAIRSIRTFAMKNVPSLKDEEYVLNYGDYVQRIEADVTAFTNGLGRRYPLTKTWAEIAKSLVEDDDFGKQLFKGIPRTTDLDQLLTTVRDPYSRMIVIHDYIRRNMRWDGIGNIWALGGVKTAWKEKKGTSGEINLLLVNLLRDAGLTAYPVLVSSHEHGTVSMSFPSYQSFDKVLAHVEINGKTYFLDGTDKFTPGYLIPQDILCTEGLLIDERSEHRYRWVPIWDSTRMNRNTVVLQAWINDSGTMDGKANISSYDYAKVKRTPFLKDEAQDYLKKFYIPASSGINISGFTFENAAVDTLPLSQLIDFNIPVNHSGEYTYFHTNLFTGLKDNPFLSDSRVSDIFFGTNQVYNIIGNFTIPDGYTFEELPKNIRFSLEDKSVMVTRVMSASGNKLNTRTTIEFKRPVYEPQEYPVLQEFYKRLYALLDEQIVIKKKNS